MGAIQPELERICTSARNLLRDDSRRLEGSAGDFTLYLGQRWKMGSALQP